LGIFAVPCWQAASQHLPADAIAFLNFAVF
jgi:hypothetical protein